MMSNLEAIEKAVEPLIAKINQHPLYSSITTLAQLRFFMEEHVFAVWDFMCLLKTLYQRLVCQSNIWQPPKDACSAHLIGEILVEEESDIVADADTYISHFDLYLKGMKKIGANAERIVSFIEHATINPSIQPLIQQMPLLPSTKQFVLSTFSFFSLSTHQLAATFVFGREAITASMFTPLLDNIKLIAELTPSLDFDDVIYYMDRHIMLDEDEHYPKSLSMLSRLTPNNDVAWQQVLQSATQALEARLNFLDGVFRKINSKTTAYYETNLQQTG